MSIDFRVRAEKMHRRAQIAEGRLMRAEWARDFWNGAHLRVCREHGKDLRSLVEAQREIKRLRAEVSRLSQKADPLRRIIELGRRFS